MAAATGLSPDACAAAALEAADAAWLRSPDAEVDVVVAGERIRVRLAGAGVAEALLPPLARVARPPEGTPAAVVTAFDAAGGAARPPLPAGPPGRRAEGGAHLNFEADAPVLSVLDPASGRGAFWTDDARALPQWHAASPLRDLVRWALRPRGVHYVHGAVVGDERGGVLLSGPPGSGKSSTAILCAARGMQHLTDDYGLVTLTDPPVAHAVFGTAKLDDASLDRLGMPLRSTAAGDKVVFEAATAGSVTDRLPLRAIVLPRVGERTGELEPVTPGRALARLAAGSLIQLAGARGEDLSALAALLRSLPRHGLQVGPDLDLVFERVEEALGG